MKQDKPKKNISLSFRIDENLNDKIEKMAENAKRSKSNFVINLLTDALEDIDRRNNLMNR